MKAIINLRQPDDLPAHGNAVVGIDRDGQPCLCRYDHDEGEWKFGDSSVERLGWWFEVPSRTEVESAAMIVRVAKHEMETESQ